MTKSKTAKLSDKLKPIQCPQCHLAQLIPRFPGGRLRAFRCMNCGVTGRIKKGKK